MPADTLSWNILADVRDLFAFPFMVSAFEAGTVVAVAAGCIGWFMVLRAQCFAGHTLAVVGFPGAAAATLAGVAPAFGFFGSCLLVALIIAAAGRGTAIGQGGRSTETAVIGTVNAFALACGFLFVNLYKGNLEGLTALLFGSFLGITSSQVLLLAAVAGASLLLLAAIGRPLLFASVDRDVAEAAGVPVGQLGVVFLALLGLAAAEAGQITGSLLVFALLVGPPATAQLLTARPALSLPLAVIIALAVTWLGLAAAYYSPFPIGFTVTTFSFAAYLLAHGARAGRGRVARPAPGLSPAS
ncbi:MAG: metal ABC transporter permease, partial [Chloroflexota bacterium]|nr:metal ABC transporter permease [Chloroflexota bacterium]